MSDQSEHGAALTARVIEVEAADAAAAPRPLAPQIIPTERTEPITPSEPALPAVAPGAPPTNAAAPTFAAYQNSGTPAMQ